MSDVLPSSAPSAGWYPDPIEPSVLRWWDGNQWTSNMQPVPQAAANTTRSPWMTKGAALGLIVLMLVLIGAGFLIIGGKADEASSDNLTPAAAQSLDADAQAQTRLAQTAVETYSTDHGGTYDGATSEMLAEIEPGLTGGYAVEAVGATYTVSVESGSGTTFSIARDSAGMMVHSCNSPGKGACPETGDWAQAP